MVALPLATTLNGVFLTVMFSPLLKVDRPRFAPVPIAGKQVVLIDDVMTTGASLHAAARVLRAAGAAGVSAVVLARTE